jgi:Histidine phosphatase superfamily (branch 2)
VHSEISPNLPTKCQYTFAQILSRHGSRYPTASKSWSYKLLIDRLQAEVQSFDGSYSFLKDYSYELGSDQLTAYGERELSVSGDAFYARYHHLTKDQLPFVRASGQDRVIQSAEKFTEGYHIANLADKTVPEKQPSPSIAVIFSEEAGSNNTLSITTCPAFSSKANLDVGTDAKATWAAVFMPAIQHRLSSDLVGANLTIDETIELMDLCPFETAASQDPSSSSPFCRLFSPTEWKSYNYYETLDKYYGHSMGNPLAPTLGVGFVNELIARLTSSPVQDETCTNHTLDSSSTTFPLEAQLYSDFSHDNDMEAIFAAVGLYNATKPLPLTSIKDAELSHGFSAAWTVPFAARMYVEKMNCSGHDEEFVRVLINNRVMPLHTCGADNLGRCTLERFVQSLSFAQGGGFWASCFVN